MVIGFLSKYLNTSTSSECQALDIHMLETWGPTVFFVGDSSLRQSPGEAVWSRGEGVGSAARLRGFESKRELLGEG